MFDQFLIAAVGEGHVVQLDPAGAALKRDCVRRVGRFGLHIEQFKHAPRARNGGLQLGDNARYLVKGLGILVGVDEEGRQAAHRQAAGNDAQRAEDAHGGVDQAVDKAGAGVDHGREKLGAQAHFVEMFVDLVEPGLGALLVPERLYDGLAAQHLLHKAAEAAADGRLLAETPGHAAGDKAGHKQADRRKHDYDGGNRGAERKHEPNGAEHGYHAGKEL